MYEFMLEKSWRSSLSDAELKEWLKYFVSSRYSHFANSYIDDNIINIWNSIRVSFNYTIKKILSF